MSGSIKSAVIAGVAFGAIMGLVFAAMSGEPVSGLIVGLVGGAIFGLLLGVFAGRQKARFATQDPTTENEGLLKQGPANHFRRFEGVGGYLYLSDTRLLFRSHAYNIQNHELSIPLAQIRDVRPSMTALIVPNGLRVTTAERVERFVVEDRRSWAEAIRGATGLSEGSHHSNS